MARLYKRGKYWWYQFRGERYSTRCTDRKAAEAAARDIERRDADATYRPAHEATLGACLSALMEEQVRRGRSDGTRQMQDVHVRHLARILDGDAPLASVDARAVDRYLRARHDEGASRATQGKELTTLRSALRLARRAGTCPFALDEVLPKFAVEYVPLERRLTEEQVPLLLDALEPERAAVCAFIVATGADWASVGKAEPSDVNLKSWRVLVRGSKNRHRWRELPVVLPLFKRLLKLAAGHLPFQPWTNAVRDLGVACRHAGIPRVTPRDLRRTHGYILRERGVEPHLIGKSLGHRDSTMAERVYARLSADAFGALMTKRVGGTAGGQKPTRNRGTRGKGAQ